MPRPCPGAGCCTPAECLAQCFCAIRIDMPEPDDVTQSDGPSCGPSDCEITAKCWACYLMLDGLFRRAASTRVYLDDCGNHNIQLANVSTGGCSSYSLGWGETDLDTAPAADCWNTANYICPDCGTESFLQCLSLYGVRGPLILLSVDCVDDCCTVEIEISYSVYQTCDLEITLPDFELLSPETRYTHLFRATNLCSCQDLETASLSFISTSSENNGRGITVPDVCNVAGATVSLVNDDNCGCICFDCLDFSNDINVALSGGEFTGTVVVEYEPYNSEPREDRNTCVYRGTATGATCQFEVEIEIECLPCEKYHITARLKLGNVGINQCIATYELLATDCATLSGFTFVSQVGTCACDLDDFTISLS